MQLPWRAAPRAALSSPLTLLVSIVTTLLLGFVVAAAVLHSSSAGSAALAYQQSRICPDSVHPSLDGDGLPLATAATMSARSPVGTVYTRIGRPDFNGLATYGRFGYRPDALSHLTVVEGGGTGLWVPQTIATAARVRVGDRLTGSPLTVTAIYADLAYPVSGFWCSEAKTVVPNPLGGDGASTSVIWVPQVSDLSSLPPEFSSGASVSLRYPTSPLSTLDEAEATVAAGLGKPLTVQPLPDVGGRTQQERIGLGLQHWQHHEQLWLESGDDDERQRALHALLEGVALVAEAAGALTPAPSWLPGLLVQQRLLAVAESEIAAAQEQILLLGRKTAMERIASFLLLQAARMKARGMAENPVLLPMTRAEVTSNVWKYIKANGLQDKVNKRNINPDGKLGAVTGNSQITMFELTSKVSKHLS